jgi:hypothetical protein
VASGQSEAPCFKPPIVLPLPQRTLQLLPKAKGAALGNRPPSQPNDQNTRRAHSTRRGHYSSGPSIRGKGEKDGAASRRPLCAGSCQFVKEIGGT